MANFRNRTGLANYDKRDTITPWAVIVSKAENGQCEVLLTNDAGSIYTYSHVTPEWARNCARKMPPRAVTRLAQSLGHELAYGQEIKNER